MVKRSVALALLGAENFDVLAHGCWTAYRACIELIMPLKGELAML